MPLMTPEQLGLLIDNHWPALLLYARQWSDAPEDAVQAAYFKLSQQRPAPPEPLSWLYRTVRHAAMTAGRTERRRRHHETRAAASAPVWFVPAEASRLDGATATEALERLPSDEREVIVARIWGGLTFEQIGALTGFSAATVHRRYVSGLTALRAALEKPCSTHRII